MVLASSTVELSKLQVQLGNAGLVPLAMHAWQEAGDKLRYSGVWHKTAKHAYSQIGLGKTFFRYGLSEPQLPGVATQASGSLIDLDLAAASMPINTKERASSNLGAAEVTLKLNPDHLGARLARAEAYLQLGANQKAMDDLDAVIKNSPQQTQAYQFRAIAHARLGHKDQAKADLEKYQRGTSSEASDSTWLSS